VPPRATAQRPIQVADDAPVPPPAAQRPTQAVDAPVRAQFAAFRASRGARDTFPAADRIQRVGMSGANPALSRFAARAGGSSYFLVPNQGGLCLLDNKAGGGCAPASVATQRGLVVADMCAADLARGFVRLAGAVPDGVDHVTVIAEDGSSRQLAVENNVFAADVAATPLPTTLTWTDGTGHQERQQAPVPDDAAQNPCGLG
jgi:hypothetical protein